MNKLDNSKISLVMKLSMTCCGEQSNLTHPVSVKFSFPS